MGRWDWTWQCQGKKVYTLAEARRAVRRLKQQRDSHWSAYTCPHCGGVHIGHTPSSRLDEWGRPLEWRRPAPLPVITEEDAEDENHRNPD